MSASEMVDIFHWGVYLFSIVTFILLLTSWRTWAAAWIAFLFFTQAIFRGCILIDLQNHFRVIEGLQPLNDSMLTASFTTSLFMQMVFTWMIILGAVVIIVHDMRIMKRG